MFTSRTVEIVIRCIAVYAVVPLISDLANLLAVVLDSGVMPTQLLVADGAASLMRLLLVVLLWLFAPPLSRWIAPAAASPHGVPELEAIAPLGFGLVGLTLAVLALSGIAFGIADLATPSPVLSGMSPEGVASLWGGIAQLLVGLGAFVGSRALGSVFTAVRRA